MAVDAVIILNRKLVLIRRKNEPYKGGYALPGGFVELGETTEEAIKREAKEETGISIKIIDLVGIYSDPSRDPRGHTVSVVYLATGEGKPTAGTDAQDVYLFSLEHLPELAFDHGKIIRDAGDKINGILSKM
ncbi:NUDIX hydrolase [Methanohalophilus sp.]|uniref:NUDIX hydrolase n=1 Tax=Methanohalophilus sp. TaxID=1966352 RepID=UPI0034351193